MSESNSKEVIFYVRRYSPDSGAPPEYKEYRIPNLPGMTVLDGLWKIKETIDPTLSWRFSCRMGICGSCAMMINGSPRLACNTQVSELKSNRVAVAPLPNFRIIRDLVPDLQPMFEAHAGIHPYLVREDRKEQEAPTGEFHQSMEELEAYLQFSYCIKCGCCMAACPTYATDPEYSGPMPLGQAHRYNTDSRDDGFSVRKKTLSGGAGPWRCHYAGECSRVCPKGVDPGKAIQLMKKDLVKDFFHLRGKRCTSSTAKVPQGIEAREGIPAAPPRTV